MFSPQLRARPFRVLARLLQFEGYSVQACTAQTARSLDRAALYQPLPAHKCSMSSAPKVSGGPGKHQWLHMSRASKWLSARACPARLRSTTSSTIREFEQVAPMPEGDIRMLAVAILLRHRLHPRGKEPFTVGAFMRRSRLSQPWPPWPAEGGNQITRASGQRSRTNRIE